MVELTSIWFRETDKDLEIYNTGPLKGLTFKESYDSNPHLCLEDEKHIKEHLAKIYSITKSKVNDLYSMQIRNLNDILVLLNEDEENQDIINLSERLGVIYFNHLQTNISVEEIKIWENVYTQLLFKLNIELIHIDLKNIIDEGDNTIMTLKLCTTDSCKDSINNFIELVKYNLELSDIAILDLLDDYSSAILIIKLDNYEVMRLLKIEFYNIKYHPFPILDKFRIENTRDVHGNLYKLKLDGLYLENNKIILRNIIGLDRPKDTEELLDAIVSI